MFKRWHSLDFGLILFPILLWILSCVVLWSLTYANPDKSISGLAIKQLIFGLIGIVGMIMMMILDYRSLRPAAWIIALVSLLLLFVVEFVGKTSLGATRWIDLKVFQLQPSEVAKLALIITLAAFLARFRGRVTKAVLIWVPVMLLVPLWLVLKQPDLGTGLILGVTTIGMMLTLKLTREQYAGIILGLILVIGVGALSFYQVKPFNLLMRDYQRSRITTFLNPESDPLNRGYNVRQAVIAVGNGGLLGRGLGKEVGQLSQLNLLPKAYTDFIFAATAEATGFVGACFLLMLFAGLMWRVLVVAARARDGFGRTLAIGYFTMLAFSILVNVGMNLGIMPVTGIPLPFISAGGTSLIINFIGIGILQSIASRHQVIDFS